MAGEVVVYVFDRRDGAMLAWYRLGGAGDGELEAEAVRRCLAEGLAGEAEAPWLIGMASRPVSPAAA